MDGILEGLAARQAITDLIYRYCRAMDRLDVALGSSIWHADGIADYGADFYQGNGRGVIEHICAQHRQALHHSHQVANILIDLDGDRAGSEAYATATLRARRGEQLIQMTIWGRYVDRWSRRNGRWGLDHRLAIRDFDEIREVTPLQNHLVGRRDLSDPSYVALGSCTRASDVPPSERTLVPREP
jgi:SnoaL-like protein